MTIRTLFEIPTRGFWGRPRGSKELSERMFLLLLAAPSMASETTLPD